MNKTTIDAARRTEILKSNRVNVWDPLVRAFHWTLAACFALAYLTEDDLLSIHVWAGYAIFGLLSFRIVWGLIGPRHARWTDFIKEPSEIIAYLRKMAHSKAEHYIGHNPAGGAMVIALIASLAVTGFTGLVVYGGQELSGPLAPWLGAIPEEWSHVLEEVHEFTANLTLVLVFLHVIGVVLASIQHRENLVKAMVTGKKRSR
jgi:cytochrome b